MKSICYLVPYFGKLPSNFDLWLVGCKYNPTINWLILTDDQTQFNLPNNVKVVQSNYIDIIERIKKYFDFDILIDRPWRLALFKSAYGEIFSQELAEYDFWGHCDVDLMWGDIRSFYTDDVLNKYERVGFLGHSTIYKNTPEVNARYKTIVPNEINHIDVFSGKSGYSFDENGMDAIYNYLDIPYFKEVVMADLEKYESSFYLNHFPNEDNSKNDSQVFLWDNGKLFRYYFYNGNIECDEFMYIHFFCRPIKYDSYTENSNQRFLIFPDKMKYFDGMVDERILKQYGNRAFLSFFCDSLWQNRKKITLKRILLNIRNVLNYMNK